VYSWLFGAFMAVQELVAGVHSIVKAMMDGSADVALLSPLLEGIPPVVLSDEERIRGVLLNLYTNAAKYTDHGAISVRVSTISRRCVQLPLAGVCGCGSRVVGTPLNGFLDGGGWRQKRGGASCSSAPQSQGTPPGLSTRGRPTHEKTIACRAAAETRGTQVGGGVEVQLRAPEEGPAASASQRSAMFADRPAVDVWATKQSMARGAGGPTWQTISVGLPSDACDDDEWLLFEVMDTGGLTWLLAPL
jgi:hypothetical protein